MSIFSKIFGSSNSATEAQLAAAQARIAELENQPAPEAEVVEVPVEVPVPQEMVSAVLCQWNSKISHMTVDEYAAYSGITVREFITQRFPSADLSRMSQLALTGADGTTMNLGLDDAMPGAAPRHIGVSQTSGFGA